MRNGLANHVPPGKRRSQGGDSKYGFSPQYPPPPGSDQQTNSPGHTSNATKMHSPHSSSSPLNQYPPGGGAEGGDRFGSSPRVNGEVSGGLDSTGYRHRSPLAHSPLSSPRGEGPPELPPRVDRTNKPGRIKSAQERLFGNKGDVDGSVPNCTHDSNYINANRGNSLERPTAKAVSAFELYFILAVCSPRT